MFFGDCEYRLVLVKVCEVSAAFLDTVVIGCLFYYGRVFSFRRDRIIEDIGNGVRTVRMELYRYILFIINLVGELLRIWYFS